MRSVSITCACYVYNAKLFLDSAQTKKPASWGTKGPGPFLSADESLLLAEHRDGDRDGDVGVQRDLDREVAHLLERPLRHADLRALDLVALLLQRFDDVVVGDRAEQAPVGPAFCVICSVSPSSLPRAPAPWRAPAVCAFSSSARRASNALRFSSVARFALPCGMRKLRA